MATSDLAQRESVKESCTNSTCQTSDDVSVVADSTLLEMSSASAQLVALRALHEEQGKALFVSLDSSARHLMQVSVVY